MLQFAAPNDNRAAAGELQDGTLELFLEARLVRWKGEPSVLSPGVEDPTVVTVLAFAEEDGPATIPGPLIRVPQGTEMRIRIRNSIPDPVAIGIPGPALMSEHVESLAGPVLNVRGLRAGTVRDDVVRVPRGEVREVRYRAEKPGTYFYWATPSERSMRSWTGRDAQLAGAIVVDPEGSTPDPEERIFVITMLDSFSDESRPDAQDDLFRRAINGRSWPDSERFRFELGETVRWRWINASFETHPMHLHGFHYRVTARGDATSETLLATDEQPWVVTEHMQPGSTFRMEWVPTRAGNWIFHCHVLDHVVPAIERDESERSHDTHDVERHALEAMAGLVLGISVSDVAGVDSVPPSLRRHRLVALEERLDGGRMRRGFALEAEDGTVPARPSVPGPALVLTRDEPTEITVVNRLSEPTTIHWHGLELESVFDGVAGWSRTGPRIAPLVAPGEMFRVRISPPRAGTFIYHTHMDESEQLVQGMAGPFIVIEPGAHFDPELDRIFLVGGQAEGSYPLTINGETEPSPASFRVGTRYRLRFIHISQGVSLGVSLSRDGVPVRWRPVAKDGAELPPSLQSEREAVFRTNTGETYDFHWTPRMLGDVLLTLRYEQFFAAREVESRQVFRVD